MKRPDIRLPWREKMTIFWLIFILNAVVVFYIIIEFWPSGLSQLREAWTPNKVAEHQGTADYWVSVQGAVYDLTNFRRCLVQIGIARRLLFEMMKTFKKGSLVWEKKVIAAVAADTNIAKYVFFQPSSLLF